jgi:hypothetical protein
MMALDFPTTVTVPIVLLAFVVWKLVFNKPKICKCAWNGYGRLPFIGTWQGVLAFMKDPQGIMAKGCRENRGGYFKVTSHTVEYLMVMDKEMIRFGNALIATVETLSN